MAKTGDMLNKVIVLVIIAVVVLIAVGNFIPVDINAGLMIFALMALAIVVLFLKLIFNIGPERMQKEDWIIVAIVIMGIIAVFYFKIIPIPDSFSLVTTQLQSILG